MTNYLSKKKDFILVTRNYLVWFKKIHFKYNYAHGDLEKKEL